MIDIDWDGWTVALIVLLGAAVGWIIGWLEDLIKNWWRSRGR